ncbi:MAG TPA: 4-hydroxy-tetrahydrodipicolinate synthase [bacterium]|jgi:4-hydroxy-tetrahydrodipicolinate synthase
MFTPFGNIVTAMVTPFDKDGNLAKDLVEGLVNHLVGSGTDTILVGGTTGESPTLTEDELFTLIEATKGHLDSKTKLLVGSGTNSTAKSVSLSKKVVSQGADGVLLVNPYYNKPTQAGLDAHFRAVAEAIDVPIMLYNIPGRTAVNMLPETIEKLAEVPNIVAVKEAAGSVEQCAKIRSLLPEDEFAIYSGDDSLTLPMLSVGAVGVVSVASHIAGKKIRKMITKFFEGDVQDAKSIHLKLVPLFEALFVRSNPIPVKYAMNKIGVSVGGYRLPLTPLDDEAKEIVNAALKSMGY